MPRRSPNVDKDKLETLRAQLSGLPSKTEYISAREAVAQLLPEIREAMKKGYSLEAIAERICKEIDITPQTLRGYLYSKDSVVKDRKSGAGATKKRKSA